MRSLRIFGLGVLGLAIVLGLPAVRGYVLFVMALVPAALLLAGQLFLPNSKRAIQVWFNPIVIELGEESVPIEPGTPVGRLSGRDLAYSYFKQWHDFEIVTHRHWLLAAIGLSSLGAFWLVWQSKDDLYNEAGFSYLIGAIWVMLVWLAKRWIWERRMLRRQGLSMGSYSVTANPKPPYFSIRYQFVDPEGHYRGGMFDSMACDRTDDMTIIFYDERDPDESVPASGLMFHKLIWKDQRSSAERPKETSSARGAS